MLPLFTLPGARALRLSEVCVPSEILPPGRGIAEVTLQGKPPNNFGSGNAQGGLSAVKNNGSMVCAGPLSPLAAYESLLVALKQYPSLGFPVISHIGGPESHPFLVLS